MLTDAIRSSLANLPATQFTGHDNSPVDRKKVLTASELGGCIRRTWFDKNDGAKDNDASNRAGMFERGKVMEDWVVRMLDRAGLHLEFAGSDQVSLVDRTAGVSGTPDGLWVTEDDEAIVIEIKSIDPRTNVGNLPRSQHVQQLQLNIELFHRITDYEPTRGLLIYVDASDWSKTVEFEAGRDPVVWNNAVDRRALLQADDPQELRPEGQVTGECRYCPFKATCGEAQFKTYNNRKATDGSGETIDAIVALASQIKVLKDEDTELRNQLKATMQDNGSSLLTSDNGVAELAEVSGRRSFNWKKAEADGLDVEPYTTVGKSSLRLTIKATKE